MLDSDEEKRKRAAGKEEEGGDQGDSGQGGGEGGEGGGLGGQGGAIEFHDFVFVGEERKLSPEQEKQLLAQHKDANGSLVEKQKKLRDERKDRKEGKTLNNQWGAGMAERNSAFLSHPIIGDAAQFSTIDPQVNFDPTINNADTNSEKKEELVYQNQLRLGLENQPRFNPKPSPF